MMDRQRSRSKCSKQIGRLESRLLRKVLAGMLVLLSAAAIAAGGSDNLQAFPPAAAGMLRHVIELPPQADESLLKVELMIGKTVKIDAVNRYFFGGELETEVIQGWGFERYILRELGPMAGTLMAVDPNAPRVERFIQLGGEARLLRYNSRVPLVVYVPEDVEVRHRLWRADTGVGSGARYVQKTVLPNKRVAVVAEGDGEARSIGSYSLRVYSTETSPSPDDTTFYLDGIVRARDGSIERVLLTELIPDQPASLVVVIRSAGTGGYQSADAFDLSGDSIRLRASVAGLKAAADPLRALQAQLE
jgi:ecotin